MADGAYPCPNDWLDYEEDDCANFASGMSAVILFKPGVVAADIFTTNLVDTTKIQALVDSGDAKILTGIQMSIEAPTPVTAPEYVGCLPDSVVTYDRTYLLKDKKVTPANVKYYNSTNASNGFKVGSMLIYECSADRISYVDTTLTMVGGRISPEGAERQRFEFTLTTRAKNDADVYPDNDAIWSIVPES